jgi:hypothetical protein
MLNGLMKWKEEKKKKKKKKKECAGLEKVKMRESHSYGLNNSLPVVAALDGYLLKLTQPPERQTRLTLQSGKEGTYCLSIFGLMSLESSGFGESIQCQAVQYSVFLRTILIMVI